MKIEVFADVVCPWCFVGEERLAKALALRPGLGAEVRWRPFQLRPEMPEGGLPWREFAVAKFGGEERMRAAFRHVSAAGAPDGIEFDFDRVASAPNTVDAHRLILLAEDRDKGREMSRALFRAYFSEGANLNDRDQLAALASGAGLDADETRAYLEGDSGVAEVWASQEEAARLGITSVPFYVFDGRYALPGSQPVEVFVEALDAVAAEKVG